MKTRSVASAQLIPVHVAQRGSQFTIWIAHAVAPISSVALFQTEAGEICLHRKAQLACLGAAIQGVYGDLATVDVYAIGGHLGGFIRSITAYKKIHHFVHPRTLSVVAS